MEGCHIEVVEVYFVNMRPFYTNVPPFCFVFGIHCHERALYFGEKMFAKVTQRKERQCAREAYSFCNFFSLLCRVLLRRRRKKR